VKISTFFLSVLITTQIAILPIKSEAVPIYFSPDMIGGGGTLNAKMPLEKLGTVNIPRGRFKIKGKWAEVSTVEEFQFDHDVVLSGPVINTQHHLENNKLEITGLAYFCRGPWLSYLSPAFYQETVSTNTGEFVGQIISVENDTVQIILNSGRYQNIPLYSVTDIDSPRSFRFRLAGILPGATLPGEPYEAESNNLSITPADRRFRLTALSRDLGREGDGDLSKSKLIAIGTAISSIEVLQMAPLIVLGLCFNHIKANALKTEAPFLTP
jgi:hypothetical protein